MGTLQYMLRYMVDIRSQHAHRIGGLSESERSSKADEYRLPCPQDCFYGREGRPEPDIERFFHLPIFFSGAYLSLPSERSVGQTSRDGFGDNAGSW